MSIRAVSDTFSGEDTGEDGDGVLRMLWVRPRLRETMKIVTLLLYQEL